MIKVSKKIKYFIFFSLVTALFFLFQGTIYSNLSYLKFLFNSQRTPEDVLQFEIPSKLNREEIRIPVTAFRATSPFKIKTKRSKENILNTIEKASLILNQADIKLETVEIRDISLNGLDYKDKLLMGTLAHSAHDIPGYNKKNLNLFFIKRNPETGIQLAAGIADPSTGICLLTDRASYPDFKVLAHEIGHLLGLEHPEIDDPKRSVYLMGEGSLLSEEECEIVYEKGESLLGEQD